MRMWKSAFILILLPGVTAAQEVFGNVSGCERHAGGASRDENAVTYDLEAFEFFESFCEVSTSTEVNGGATLLNTTCFGSGAEWDLSFIVETTEDEDTLVFYGTDSPSERTAISLCE